MALDEKLENKIWLMSIQRFPTPVYGVIRMFLRIINFARTLQQ